MERRLREAVPRGKFNRTDELRVDGSRAPSGDRGVAREGTSIRDRTFPLLPSFPRSQVALGNGCVLAVALLQASVKRYRARLYPKHSFENKCVSKCNLGTRNRTEGGESREAHLCHEYSSNLNTCHPNARRRGGTSHPKSGLPSVPSVIQQFAGGPSPSTRLGMTAFCSRFHRQRLAFWGQFEIE